MSKDNTQDELKYARCELCRKDINITSQKFCDYDEMPIVLSAQLNEDSEEAAIEFALKHHQINPEDYYRVNDEELRMYQHDNQTVSHKDIDDEDAAKHHLASRFWSFQ